MIPAVQMVGAHVRPSHALNLKAKQMANDARGNMATLRNAMAAC
jgi:hypothetical protein